MAKPKRKVPQDRRSVAADRQAEALPPLAHDDLTEEEESELLELQTRLIPTVEEGQQDGATDDDEVDPDPPLLTLRTYKPTRKPVRIIDGATGKARIYMMRLMREFAPIRRQYVENIWNQMVLIMGRVERNEEISEEEEAVVNNGYVLVLRAAFPEMSRKLIEEEMDAVQRETLVAYFFRVTGEERQRGTTPALQPTGDVLRHASNPPTGDTRANG